MKEAGELKQRATEIIQDAMFTLHKWHSNEPAFEEPVVSSVEDVTYAKRQLGTAQGEESSLLGLSWQKAERLLLKEEPCKSLQESMIHWDWCHPRPFKEN